MADRPDRCAEVAADWSRGVTGGGGKGLRGQGGRYLRKRRTE